MTSPDSNDDATSSKYHIPIDESQGIVIGDHAQVVQQFYGTPAEPQVDLTATEVAYRHQVVDAYKWLNFSGFARPDLSLANVPLEEVFVRLTLTAERVIPAPVPLEKPSQAEWGESWQRERKIIVQEPIELGQALSNHLLLVGEPGAGKSTLLRWLAVTFAEACQREPNRVGPSADADRLPVLVELGRLPDRYVKPESGEAPNWLQLLPKYLTDQLAFTNTLPQLLTQALDEGRCLLLFDGLDEVADRQARTRLARSLVELARFSPGNRVIIGSRPAGVSESEGALHPHFQRCQIKRFTPEDVQRFFRFWYAQDRGLTPEQQRDAADALYARVQATPATMQLATTPLLSTILVLIWRNEGDLPERRVELYERCCRVLIEHWEASHDVAYQGALGGMDWEDHLRLLTPLAYAIHSQEQRTSATREELVLLLTQTLQTEGYYQEQAAATQGAKQFLNALGLRSGLLQYLGDDRYGFPHQTLQEYLAARHILDPRYPESYEGKIGVLVQHALDDQWREVLLLACEASKKALEDLIEGFIRRGETEEGYQPQLYLLADACAKASHEEVGMNQKFHIDRRLKALDTLKSVKDVEDLEAAGKLALPYLSPRLQYSADMAAACVRVLTHIRDEAAIEVLATYTNDFTPAVVEALVAGLRKSDDKQAYADRLLTHITDLNLTASLLLEYLQYIPNLASLRLWYLPKESDLRVLARLPIPVSLRLWYLPKVSDLRVLAQLPIPVSLELERLPEVSDMSVLGQLPNLTSLVFWNLPKESDLRVLARLPIPVLLRLRYLPKVSDLRVLGQLPSLTSLELHNNWAKVSDLSMLGQLPNLTSLVLERLSKVSDLSMLAQLPNLTSLELWDLSKVSDLSMLAQLPKLTSLGLGWLSKVSNWSMLAQLPKLTSLELGDLPEVSILSVLGQLPKLTSLQLGRLTKASILSILGQLGQLPNLTSLVLWDLAKVSDLSMLAQLPNLTSLELNRLPEVSDLSMLAQLPNLTLLELGRLPKESNLSVPSRLTRLIRMR